MLAGAVFAESIAVPEHVSYTTAKAIDVLDEMVLPLSETGITLALFSSSVFFPAIIYSDGTAFRLYNSTNVPSNTLTVN